MEPLLENNKIYIRGLPEEVTENALSEHFEKYGRVSKATVAIDGLTRKPRGFGFVCFADEDSAKAAIGDVEDHVILGTKVEVKEAIRWESTNCKCIRNDLRQGKKIFVGGLPHDLTGEEFESFFKSFGKTTDVVIIVDKVSRISRGFGFVTYESEESARAVLKTSRYLIRGKEVEVKESIPKKASNTTEHPNVHPQGQHHPSAVINGYHHYSSFRPMHGMIVGPPYANSAPIYPYPHVNGMVATSPAYAYGMAAPSPAHALNGFHGYNGHGRTASNGNRAALMPAPRPFTKIRISKPPGIIEKDSACSSSAPCVEDPSPASEDSNIDGRPSPSVIYDGKDQASENGQNDS